MAKPKLIVFDLDYTLWPFYVSNIQDKDAQFRHEEGVVYDRQGRAIECYPDVPDILKHLSEEGYSLGVASRTWSNQMALDLMQAFNWRPYFTQVQIYPGGKTEHFNSFRERSGFKYQEMLFFDDEPRNIRDVSKLGVTCIYVEEGVSWDVLKKGLDQFAANHQS